MGSKNRNLVIVRSVLDQRLTVGQAARKYGLSRQWIYELIRRYQAAGPPGLEPGSRAPHRNPQATPDPVRARILALRAELAGQGADNGAETIAWHLRAEGLAAPSRATIHRILAAAGLVPAQPQKRPRSAWQRFEAELPNGCWQADITHWYLADATRVEILDFLDDHSRFLLHLQARTAFTGADVVAAMTSLISTYGAPAATLTDNGLVFTARLAGRRGARNGFETLLAAQGITQKNGAPNHPQTQGKIERFHQTLKHWLTARPRPADLPTLQGLLDDFRHWYNTARPHRAIGRRTPEQAYTALPKAIPGTTGTPEHRVRTDTVDRDGKISLRYAGQMRHLGIGRAWAGRQVLMLIQDRRVTTTDAATAEIIAEHTIDPARDYQPQPPRIQPGTDPRT